MNLHHILQALEQWAPPSLQESYDNSGLLVGEPDMVVHSALVALDCTEEVIEEASARGANLVIAHHPILFGGLKRFTGKTYVERTVMAAMKKGIAIYAIHTNLDNVAHGVNAHLSKLLGLSNTRILSPKSDLLEKLVVFVPHEYAEAVRGEMFKMGAGSIGAYDECSFNLKGEGTFRGDESSSPFVGNQGERHTESETRVEVLVEKWRISSVLEAMKRTHPYEEVAYDRIPLRNSHAQIGSGMIGDLELPMKLEHFFDLLKQELDVKVVKHTRKLKSEISKVAVCGGAGFFLLQDAMRSGADIFVTSDVKYHQFFDAENRIVLADIGHWESEHRAVELLREFLKQKIPTFAVHLSESNTNPVNYY